MIFNAAEKKLNGKNPVGIEPPQNGNSEEK